MIPWLKKSRIPGTISDSDMRALLPPIQRDLETHEANEDCPDIPGALAIMIEEDEDVEGGDDSGAAQTHPIEVFDEQKETPTIVVHNIEGAEAPPMDSERAKSCEGTLSRSVNETKGRSHSRHSRQSQHPNRTPRFAGFYFVAFALFFWTV